MHLFAKLDQNISCGSRVMIIFTDCQNSHRDYIADSKVVQSYATLVVHASEYDYLDGKLIFFKLTDATTANYCNLHRPEQLQHEKP